MRPGDLILTQTPSQLFGYFRTKYVTTYDHVVAVIDSERSLHISYPIAKVVPTILFLQKKKHPLILRCNFETEESRLKYIESVKHKFVGRKYDFKRIVHLMFYS